MGTAARGGATLSLLIGLSCASGLVPVEGGYRHTDLGISFRDPDPPWRRVELADSVIAYRGRDRETMSLRSTCGRPLASAPIMARHLRIGIGPHAVRAGGPVSVDSRDGWTQTFDVASGGSGVRIKTVTVVLRSCSLDWLLAAPAPSDSGVFEAEGAFDAWWQSFRLPPDPEGESA